MSSKSRGLSWKLSIRGLYQFAIFALAIVCILIFFYLNTYVLPLGDIGVSGAIENSSSLSGMRISVWGKLSVESAHEFLLIDISTEEELRCIWLGEGDMPLSGIFVMAEGQMVDSSLGTVLMCESLVPDQELSTIYENPWSLPALRIINVVLFWYVITAFITALLAIRYLLRPNVLLGNRMRAMGGVSILSGAILITTLAVLTVSEISVSHSIGLVCIGLFAGLAMLIVAFIMRKTNEPWIADLADAIPILAGIAVVLGVLTVLMRAAALPADILGDMISDQFPVSASEILIGTIGFVLLGLYLSDRKYALTGVTEVLAVVKIGVR